MQFHIRINNYSAMPQHAAEARSSHLNKWAEHIVWSGLTVIGPESQLSSLIFFVEFDSWQDVYHFIDEEPSHQESAGNPPETTRWKSGFNQKQRDFEAPEGHSYWYINGIGRLGAAEKRNPLLSGHLDYLAKYDDEHIMVRGPNLDEEGSVWQGSAMIVAFASRAEVDKFLANEPFTSNGLYEQVDIERFIPDGNLNSP